MVELVLKIMPKAKGFTLMVQALASIMFKTKFERGCIDCQYYAERENPRSVRYVEQWETLEDVELHIRAQQFGMLLSLMETAEEMPTLEIHTGSEILGLDYIRAARLGGSSVSVDNSE